MSPYLLATPVIVSTVAVAWALRRRRRLAVAFAVGGNVLLGLLALLVRDREGIG